MIYYYTTQDKNCRVTFEDAVMRGMAEDGGLFVPERIPEMPEAYFKRIGALSFSEIAYDISSILLQDVISQIDLKTIIAKAFTFDAPLKELSPNIYALELFHGPTLSFKDFGARFMAQLMSCFAQQKDKELNILVATAGDTGSAIAQAFLNVPGTKVWILYPKGKVSWSQEKQLTTFGQNITALEIDGSFDDCQRLVKQAFSDPVLRKKISITSANSINIARLLPQMFYYFYAFAQLKEPYLPLVFSVPSGNYGNLIAGLWAKRMGVPINHFVAATNANDCVPRYLESGSFEPHPSIHTMSNAMDVGNPNNFVRMLDLYAGDREQMRRDISGISFTDSQTESAIKDALTHYGYLLDPHGAVAYLGLKSYLSKINKKANGVFLETAHPAKFTDSVEKIVNLKIPIPERLQKVLSKEKQSILLSTHYNDFLRILQETSKNNT